MQASQTTSADVSLAFKRHILQESDGFVSEPMADLYRVNLLSRMLDRFDALCAQGMNEAAAQRRVIEEYGDIPAQMRAQGFEEIERALKNAQWPLLTEEQARRYIHERDAYLHRTALGVMLCTACVTPVMLGASLEVWLHSEFFTIMGMLGMFAMIALGVYAMVTAAKPKDGKRVKKGRFSLSSRLRRKLESLAEQMEAKVRRRRGKGIALIISSLGPVLAGAALSEVWYSDFWPILGDAGMFVMIGAGVYELIMADGERKTIKRLLDER